MTAGEKGISSTLSTDGFCSMFNDDIWELLNDDKLDRNNWFAMNTQLHAGNQNHWIALTLCLPDKLY
jgi:hypothetical protein